MTFGLIREVVLKNTSLTNWAEVKAHLERNLVTRDIAKRVRKGVKTLQQKSDENIRQVGQGPRAWPSRPSPTLQRIYKRERQ